MDDWSLYELAKIQQREVCSLAETCATWRAARHDRRLARRDARAARHAVVRRPAAAGDVVALPQRFDDAA